MKKKFKVLFALLFTILVTGCAKNIDKLSYTDYNEYYSNKKGYVVIDNTKKYDIDIRRYLEAGEGNIQIFYIEFSNEKNADEYIKNEYKNEKVKNYKKYTYIKSKKNGYMKLYKVNNVIVIGSTNNKKYKKLVNKTLKDLGF